MNKNAKDAPILIAGTGSLQGEKWNIFDEVIIGRDHSCDIVIDNRQVSRQHARIFILNDNVLIEDLHSKNGTTVDHIKLKNEPLPLQDSAKIQIALTQEFTYYLSDATVALNLIEKTEVLDDIASKNKIGLRIEERSRRVQVNQEEIIPPLSKAQYVLLNLLEENENTIVSREECIKAVWGDEGAYDVSNQALDALIRRLRVRISEIDPEHTYIVTVRGHGLRFENRK